jgi:hypothetical protein
LANRVGDEEPAAMARIDAPFVVNGRRYRYMHYAAYAVRSSWSSRGSCHFSASARLLEEGVQLTRGFVVGPVSSLVEHIVPIHDELLRVLIGTSVEPH